jgi:integrase
MPYKQRRSKCWYGQYKDPASGKWIKRTTGATKKAEAARIERRWQLEADEARRRGIVPSGSLGDAMFHYFEATSDKPTSDRDAYSAEHLLGFFGERRMLDEIKPSDVTTYQKHRLQTASAGTYNKEVGLLSVTFNYAKRELDWNLGDNPCSGKRCREPKSKINSLTVEDAARMVSAVDQQAPHTIDLIELACQTGCRKKELLCLTWDRVDLNAREIILGEDDTKTARERRVPLNKAAKHVLIRRASLRAVLCPNTPWVFFHVRPVLNKKIGDQIGDVRRSIQTAARRAGLTGVSFHTLRHTCGSWLAAQGTASVTIRDILGHTTIRMTDRYLHAKREQQHKAVENLRSIST